jgi:hypothetical protein
MKIRKRDWLTIAIVVAGLVVLIMSTVREKVNRVPVDDKHRPFYESMKKGDDRIQTEKKCLTCHNPEAIPLPKKHPPKEQCLICHKLPQPKH